MFLLNKVSTSQRNSRELSPEEQTEFEGNNMDYMYSTTNPDFKPKARRQRSRTSFFDFGGSKRSSREYIPDDLGDLSSSRSSSRMTLNEKSSTSSLSPRRRLRKASSKASLASMASFVSQSQSPVSEKSKSRLFPDQLFRAGSWVPTDQQISITRPKASISQPFNFTHLTHHNPRDASHIRYGDSKNMGEEWNKALVRESQVRPLTAQPSMQSIQSFHSRNESVTTISSLGSRARSGSTKSVSPQDSFSDLSAPPPPPPPPSREPINQQQHSCPITPPLRSSSRHCLRILEQPEEEDVSQTAAIESNDDIPDDVALFPNEEVGQAVTTVGDSSYGRKSVGLETILQNPLTSSKIEGTEFPSPPTPTETEIAPAVRETRSSPDLNQSAKDFAAERRQQALLTVRQRPLSQLSQVSDTLNGNFTIPPSPIARYGSVRSRCMSRRMSAHIRSHGDFTSDPTGLDSWEEDIDWCYEHEADADCDFDWDKGSTYSASNYSEHPSAQSTRAPSPLAFYEPLKNDLTQIPEQNYDEEPVICPTVFEQPRHSERRITGVFEDKLLLPPSPSFPPSPRFPPGLALWGLPQPTKMEEPSRARDSGFEIGHTDDQLVLVPAGTTSLRHRSISSSPPLPDLVPEHSYREELNRVACQLDAHIAALNKECYYPPPLTSLPKRPSLAESIQQITGNRPRANSEATCVTLCSDTDTITPTEANEVITPSSSAHNSFNFTKPRSSSIVGAGFAVEGRIEKGLSFPAAAIPGVVELGPDSLHNMYAPEDEFVPFI